MSIDTTSKTDFSLPLSTENGDWLKSKIRDVPDFPKPGIMFKSMTTLFKDSEAFTFAIDVLTEKCRELRPDVIVGIEARGFVFAPTVAYKLQVGFVPVRKPGKLPHHIQKASYDLEYGSSNIEIHTDAVESGQRVIILDDLLATGGTAAAARQLLQGLGANVVGIGFLAELGFLSGRQRLPETDVFALIEY